MKKLGLLLLLLALGYVAYPFWTIIRIAHAVKHGDIPTLEAMIDWPKVRDGIKSDVTGPRRVGNRVWRDARAHHD